MQRSTKMDFQLTVNEVEFPEIQLNMFLNNSPGSIIIIISKTDWKHT